MKIPARLDGLLKKATYLYGPVMAALGHFEEWISDNRLVFFSGFTNHGIKHVRDVIYSSEAIIREESWPHLTPQDSAVMLLSILLHDSAMHLSEDGFQLLVSGKSEWRAADSDFFEPTNWTYLWETFLGEASRFNEKKLTLLFGKPEPVTELPDDPLRWTEMHKILIGEFLRRHHGTLAHEFALTGVPGPQDKRLTLDGIDDGIRDLIGFTARSHCLDLRTCVDRLLKKKQKRTTVRGVHVPFLMGVLRIADYLQIQAARAPEEILLVRALHSPVSQQEWNKHQTVWNIDRHENDPECLFVDAEPKDVKTFLGLRDLLAGLQQELDATWALWGEVYGHHPQLRNLGISIRRIRSSLDEPEMFEKKTTFLPVHAQFKIADAQMLKLMVGPLYDDHPSYGVRELIQNAVDACLERDDYLRRFGLESPDLASLPADVVVTFEEKENGGGQLRVEDSGIGMTSDIILGYFLNAGASYRDSEQWYKLHAQDDKPRVIRSGRFGIGILAAFLIGSELDVSTRHISETEGISFTCRLNDREIELRRMPRQIGTSVSVTISPQDMGVVASKLADLDCWDWYALDYPIVMRRVMMQDRTNDGPLPQRYVVPQANSSLPEQWRRLKNSNFYDVQWTWDGPGLVCNGFLIKKPHDVAGLTKFQSMHYMDCVEVQYRRLSLSVFDKFGRLPLNLQRNDLSRPPMLYTKELEHAICRDILAFFLINGSEPYPSKLLLHPAFAEDSLWGIVFTDRGFTLAEPGLLQLSRPTSVCFLPRVHVPSSAFFSAIHPCEHVVLLGRQDEYIGRDSFQFARMICSHWPSHMVSRQLRGFHPWNHFQLEAAAFLLPRGEESLDNVNGLMQFPLRRRRFSRDLDLWHTVQEEPGDWLEFAAKKGSRIVNPQPAAFLKLGKPFSESLPLSPLGEMWKQVIGKAFISYDRDQRFTQLYQSFRELKKEVRRWGQPGT